jgi:hypothetical protein
MALKEWIIHKEIVFIPYVNFFPKKSKTKREAIF